MEKEPDEVIGPYKYVGAGWRYQSMLSLSFTAEHNFYMIGADVNAEETALGPGWKRREISFMAVGQILSDDHFGKG